MCILNPIFVVGPHCSGKTLLARCLSLLDGLMWWEEPNTVWRSGNIGAEHDRRQPVDIGSPVALQIRRSYTKKQVLTGCNRLVDDSPLHCVDLPFVRSVFPEAVIIHIFRDPRDAVYDTLQQWHTPIYQLNAATLRFVIKRLGETPLQEWGTYFMRAARALRSRLISKNLPEERYGVRYPGMRMDARMLTLEELACRQWQECQRYVLNDLSKLPPNTYLCVAYETFVNAPLETFRSIIDFIGATMNDRAYAFVSREIVRDHVGIGSDMFATEYGQHLLSLLEPARSRVDVLLLRQSSQLS